MLFLHGTESIGMTPTLLRTHALERTTKPCDLT
jgi:hypothetical protein